METYRKSVALIESIDWEPGYYWVRNTATGSNKIVDRIIHIHEVTEEFPEWRGDRRDPGNYVVVGSSLLKPKAFMSYWNDLQIQRAVSPF